jgi:hypothetical protein
MRLQTLGDAIDGRMRDRGDSLASAAAVLGVTAGELLCWLSDERVPVGAVTRSLLGYLAVDEDEFHVLSVRGQMRHAQIAIRFGSPVAA